MNLMAGKVYLTPDKTVVWDKVKTRWGADLYLAPDAPVEAYDSLARHKSHVGNYIDGGNFGFVYRPTGTDLAVKHSKFDNTMPRNRWDKYAGIASIALNVQLQEGLSRIGEDARLSNGAIIITPEYYGALLWGGMVHLLMSYEPGAHPDESQTYKVGSRRERRVIYDAAVASVGVDPTTIGDYDDSDRNLLFRDDPEPVVVKLDACSRQSWVGELNYDTL